MALPFGREKSKEDDFSAIRSTLALLMDRISSLEKRMDEIEERQELLSREFSKLSEEIENAKRHASTLYDRLEGKLKTLGLEYSNIKVDISSIKRELNEKARVDEVEELKEYVKLVGGGEE